MFLAVVISGVLDEDAALVDLVLRGDEIHQVVLPAPLFEQDAQFPLLDHHRPPSTALTGEVDADLLDHVSADLLLMVSSSLAGRDDRRAGDRAATEERPMRP